MICHRSLAFRCSLGAKTVRWCISPPRLRSYSRKARRSPLEQYDFNVSQGKIRSDDFQRKMLGDLTSVYEDLQAYKPPKQVSTSSPLEGVLGSVLGLFSKRSSAPSYPGPRGIYLYGDVGSGKTMLMDMFYTTVPVHLTKKRVHFHAFMQDVHKRGNRLKQEHGQAFDTADQIASEVAQSGNVLCLDEMQVTDVGDAMILRRILKRLYQLGVVTFFTSNRVPIDLYKNGVQRELFLSTIDLIETRNHVIHLISPTDYRSLPRPSSGAYLFKDPKLSTADNAERVRKHIEHWFQFFAEGEKLTTECKLEVWGRKIPIPISAGKKVMQFTFTQLCGQPRSAADYLEMCRTFPAAIVTDIPMLSLDAKNEVRRFITFLDAAYDSHTKLVATAERPFEELFGDKLDSKLISELADKHGTATAPQELSLGSAVAVTSENQEEVFAYARALSRLRQMNSEEWLDFER